MPDSSARPSFDPASAKRWVERLKRFAAGGLSVVAFCAAEGVSQANFYLWRRRLAQPVPSPDASTPAVVPIRVAPAPPLAPPLELALPSGATLRFPADTRPELIAAVLRGL